MMPDNLFKKAVDKNETNEFFKGEGDYYSHNPMDGEHCYGIRLSGDANKFIELDVKGAQLFSQCFKNFIDSLSPDCDGLTHLLSNVSEIQRLRKKGLLQGVDYDSSVDSNIVVSIKKYLKSIKRDEKSNELIKMYLRLLEMDESQATASVIRQHLEAV